jgi:hypothetical protein
MTEGLRRTQLSVAIAVLLASRVSGAADFIVDSTADVIAADGAVTLREAITAANSNAVVNGDLPAGDPDGDRITFDPALFTSGQTILLALGQLPVTDDLVVDGAAGGASVTLDAKLASRILDIDTAEVVRVTGVGFLNGQAPSGENGGAIRLSKGDLTLTGITVTQSGARSGGAIDAADSRLAISGSTFSGNYASVNGGALHASGGTITISNSTVSGNGAGQEGGGLWNGGGDLSLAGVTVAGNVALIQNAAADAQGGGGVFNNGGTVSIANSTIDNNLVSGASAGADDGGGGIFNDGRNAPNARITLSGATTVSNNLLTGASLNGGGGLNIGADNGAAVIASAGVQFIGNTATRAGGALETNSGTLSLTGVSIHGNSTGVNGGGVHATGADQTTISSSSILNNTAGQEGGGLWNSATGEMQVSNSTLSGNTALIGNAANDAQGGGGAFNNGGTLGLHNTTIANNVVSGSSGGADDGGGGIFNDGRNAAGARIDLTGSTTISGNTAFATSLNGGGGLVIGANNGAELTAATGVSITGNTAARAGGGLETNNATMTLTGIEIRGNSAGVNGGGVHATGADQTTISGVTITDNTAGQEGGGLWNSATGHMALSGSTVSGNTALIGNAANDAQGGGGAFNNGGTLTIANSTIDANVVSGASAGADDGGGGVFNDGRNSAGARIVITGSSSISHNTALNTSLNGAGGLNLGMDNGAELYASIGVRFNGNTAARAGGALETNRGILTLVGVEIRGNSSGVNGGGVHVTGSDQTTLTGATIAGNTAGQEGGGVWNSATGSMMISMSTVSGNTALIGNAAADAQGGGGVFNNGGNVEIADTWISRNVVMGASAGADDGGGGVFNDGRNSVGARISLTGATTLSYNTALSTSLNGAGGLNIGVYGNGAELSAAGSVWIYDNFAARAGGGLETFNGILNLSGVQIFGNSSGVNGGGVHVTGRDMTTLANATVSANTAGQEGGGIWNSATGNLVVLNSTISANTALAGNSADAQGGGGLFNNGGVASLTGCELLYNVVSGNLDAADGGAGIFNDGRNTDGALVELTSTSVLNNAVLHSGIGLGGRGGGIMVIADFSNQATVMVSGGTVNGNEAMQAGGGIEVRVLDSDTMGLANASLHLSGTDVRGNLTDNNGGGIHLGGIAGVTYAKLADSWVVGNMAGNEGGGLWIDAASSLSMTTSQVDGNQAPNGGGLFMNGFDGVRLASAEIEESAIVRNEAAANGGGIDAERGTLTIVNSTISGNTAGNVGGGLNLDPGMALNMQFATVAENSAAELGGGMLTSGGGVISSLFGYNQAAAGRDVFGALDSVGYSLFSDTDDLTINLGVANQLNVPPLIGTLADNGGPTQTHALRPASTAIDKGDPSLCPDNDQRLALRNVDNCDIGAYEAGGEPEPDQIFKDSFETPAM